MLYCPKCHAEYEDVASRCADCNVALVRELPEPPTEEEEELIDWVQLARSTSREYAGMLVEALQANEIPAVLISGGGHFGPIGVMGPTSVFAAGGGFSIAVPKERVAEADAHGAAIFGEEWEKCRLYDLES